MDVLDGWVNKIMETSFSESPILVLGALNCAKTAKSIAKLGGQ